MNSGERDTNKKDQLDEFFRNKPEWDRASFQAIESAIRSDLKPVRRLSGISLFALLFILAALAIVAAGACFLASHGWNALTPAARLSVFTVLALSAVLLAFALAQQMVPGSRVYWTTGFLFSIVSALILAICAAIFHIEANPHFLRSGLICLGVGTSFAIPAAILFATIAGRGVVLSRERAWPLGGMLAGLVGMTVLEIHCPILDLRHIAAWHFGIPLAGALTGYLFARQRAPE